MKKIDLKLVIEYLLCLFVFLLPLQTRYIFDLGESARRVGEYGVKSLYGLEILWAIIVILAIIELFYRLKIEGRPRFVWRRFIEKENLIITASLFLVLWSLASIIWSGDKLLALEHAGFLIQGIVIFFLILSGFAERKKISLAIVISAAAQGFLAWLQFLSQTVVGNKWLGIAAQSGKQLGVSVVEFADERWLRAYGSLPHPNILAGFLAVGFLFLLGLAHEYYAGEKRSIRYSLGIYLGAAAILGGLVFSFSRAAWLAVAGAIILYVVILFFNRKKLDLKINWRAAIQFLVFCSVLCAFLSGVFWGPISTRLFPNSRLEVKSIDERINYYEQGLSVIRGHRFLGTGIGNYTRALYDLIPEKMPSYFYQPVHNIYLLIWAELGIVGLVLFLLLIGLLVYKFISFKLAGEHWNLIYGLAMAVLLIIGFFDHWLWSMYFGTMLFWLIVSLTIYFKAVR